MYNPSVSDLVISIVDAGRDLNVEITSDSEGVLWITSRSDSPVTPPVAIRFTNDSLRAYFRSIADDTSRGEQSPWQWWNTLMSTHLYESLYEMDKIGKECVVVIGPTGFTATTIDRGAK